MLAVLTTCRAQGLLWQLRKVAANPTVDWPVGAPWPANEPEPCTAGGRHRQPTVSSDGDGQLRGPPVRFVERNVRRREL